LYSALSRAGEKKSSFFGQSPLNCSTEQQRCHALTSIRHFVNTRVGPRVDWTTWQPVSCKVGRLDRRPGGPLRQM